MFEDWIKFLAQCQQVNKVQYKVCFYLIAINVFFGEEIRYSESKILSEFIYALLMSDSVFSLSLKLLVLHHKINNSDDRERDQ